MNDGDLLLKAIIANPDEDTPRLALADWLQENGHDERAEFIRVQIELARTPEPEEVTVFVLDDMPVCKACQKVRGGSGLCRYHELRAREDALTSGNEVCEWFTPNVFASHIRWQFRRGFVESVTCSAADWLAHGDAVLAAHPVRRVVLTTRLEVTHTDQPTGHTAPGCIYTLRVRALPPGPFLEPGQDRWKALLLSSPETDVLLADFGAGFIPEADGYRAVFDRFWPGVEIERPPAGVANFPGPAAANAEVDALLDTPFVPTPDNANYAAAKASQDAWNRMIGGTLEDMITQDGILPGGDEPDDEDDEDDTDTDPPA